MKQHLVSHLRLERVKTDSWLDYTLPHPMPIEEALELAKKELPEWSCNVTLFNQE